MWNRTEYDFKNNRGVAGADGNNYTGTKTEKD